VPSLTNFVERFNFEVDLVGDEDLVSYDPEDLRKEFCSFLLKISIVEAYQLPLPEGSAWALMVETKEPMPGGEHWLKTDLSSEGTAILPLKSSLLPKYALARVLHLGLLVSIGKKKKQEGYLRLESSGT